MNIIAGLSLEQTVALVSAGIAVISFAFNWAVVSRQTAMQAEGLKAQMDAEVMRWAQSAVDALTAAGHVARSRGALNDEAETRRETAAVANRLSALADHGRLFFPNLAPDDHGGDKEAAFQGYRPPVLDALVLACQRLERMDPRNLGPDDATAAFFMRCRRLLISEVQRAIDPRRRGRMMRRLAISSGAGPSGFREAAGLAQELEAAHPGILSGKRDEAWVSRMEKLARG